MKYYVCELCGDIIKNGRKTIWMRETWETFYGRYVVHEGCLKQLSKAIRYRRNEENSKANLEKQMAELENQVARPQKVMEVISERRQ